MTLFADPPRVTGDTSGVVLHPADHVTPVAEAPTFAYDVAIVGLGYVGLPTAISYHTGGNRVLGLDVSARRLATIRAGKADLLTRDQDRLAVALEGDALQLTDDPSRLREAAAIVVCVPTPVDEHLVPDLGILRSACDTVVANAVPGQTIMLTSTTYVGCTQDFLVTPLRERGLRAGTDLFVAFSAERIDPGNDAFDQSLVPRVVGGATAECRAAAVDLLQRYALEVHQVGSLAAAEMTKLLENTFRAVNIALANEFSDICEHLGIEVNDVIDAASTKPYGFMAFRPGPGVGGHCIPCDPHYLLWQLKRDRVDAPLIERTMTEIAQRPGRVVEQAKERLAANGASLRRSKVLVVGVSYKPDVADLRESPALEILERLEQNGARIGYLDHHFDTLRLPSGAELEGTTDPAAFGADLVLIHTSHRDVDLSWITPSQTVLDTRYPARRVVTEAAI
ncbi:nucleotide sugar dehydrogenase [uncultured Amnibacterium sp.]|uniref:nucleotide sugar dehydrogenase n=1 Tax=uncultured Amnibacterium sp. TaxID=1631851 RepID=UPI0035C94AEF